jgi:glutamate synthase (NADPH/NADH) large chain
VINYFFMVAEECRRLMSELGFRSIDEMVGHSDRLEMNDAIDHWKARGLDLTPMLQPAVKPRPGVQVYCTQSQNHSLDEVLDNELIEQSWASVTEKIPKRIEMPIENIDRAFGTMLSHRISKYWGSEGLPEGTIHIKATGSAGQSLGAWLARGVTIELEGDSNDYVGKGLSGGRIIVYPPKSATFLPEENIIIGNVALYGAIAGEAYFRGQAAERFCVRNSGATAVVEGVGDHGCEYMTGGCAVVLGSTGRNFAAGMSGGIAYVYDADDELLVNCNMEMVELEPLCEDNDIEQLRQLIENHRQYTGSAVAAKLLSDWKDSLSKFKKVMPTDYKRALQELAESQISSEDHGARANREQPAALAASSGGQT